jgi:hypothetical protein
MQRTALDSLAPSLLSLLVISGCGAPVDLGSDLLFTAEHESGDLEEWLAGDEGGVTGDADGAVELSSDFAHRGRYSVKLTATSTGDDGPSLFRELAADRAFYSAWYYLPKAYDTVSYWTVQQFESRTSDGDAVSAGLDLRLRTLPGGEVVLYVFHNEPEYLQSPLADPPPYVPVGRWFQIESEFVARTDATGSLRVWLDGELVYTIEGRPTVKSETVHFAPSSLAIDIGPAPVELFVDDVAISRTRVTPDGVLSFD